MLGIHFYYYNVSFSACKSYSDTILPSPDLQRIYQVLSISKTLAFQKSPSGPRTAILMVAKWGVAYCVSTRFHLCLYTYVSVRSTFSNLSTIYCVYIYISLYIHINLHNIISILYYIIYIYISNINRWYVTNSLPGSPASAWWPSRAQNHPRSVCHPLARW